MSFMTLFTYCFRFSKRIVRSLKRSNLVSFLNWLLADVTLKDPFCSLYVCRSNWFTSNWFPVYGFVHMLFSVQLLLPMQIFFSDTLRQTFFILFFLSTKCFKRTILCTKRCRKSKRLSNATKM